MRRPNGPKINTTDDFARGVLFVIACVLILFPILAFLWWLI